MTRSTLLLLLLLSATSGCQRELIETPTLYVNQDVDPFADVPPALQGGTVDLLYVTDRALRDHNTSLVKSKYGYERSPSAAFGSVIVEIGHDLSWEQVVEASRSHNRKVQLPLRLALIEEQVRFPPTPPPIVVVDGEQLPTPEYTQSRDEAIEALHDELERRVSHTPRKEAFVFVHGYNTTLRSAAFRLAELWHFLGREGVPILYSWPAGAPGLIKGYTRDRESGEFTIFHLKEFIRALAASPGIETINIIAHSRGTDVVGTAIRELIATTRAGGEDPIEVLKLGHIVMAAPDIDAGVTAQRFAAERIMEGIGQMTLYVTKNDRALGAAEWLFSTPNRLGKVRPEFINDVYLHRLEAFDNLQIVDARIRTDYLGHNYFLSNPATLSDLILVLRYDRSPGAENVRPLRKALPNYFILDDDYPSP